MRHRRRLLALPQCFAKPFADDIPALAGVRIRFVILQAFVDDFAVPFRDGHLLGSGGDSIPQRLDVLDLLVDREPIESWRDRCSQIPRGKERRTSRRSRPSAASAARPSSAAAFLGDGFQLGERLQILDAPRCALHLDQLLERKASTFRPEHGNDLGIGEQRVVRSAVGDGRDRRQSWSE
jgi:hypothetical protein